MAEVPRSLTPITANEAAALMVSALQSEPNPELTAQHFLALVWIETAQGHSVIQHNWGNITGEYQGNFWRPPWYTLNENSTARQKDLHAKMLVGKAPSKFRAYSSRGEGLDDFLKLLHLPRYAPMLNAARKGDTRAFADAVHDTGYCPDDACKGENTISTYRKLTAQFAPILGLPTPAGVPPVPPAGVGTSLIAAALVGIGLYYLSRGLRRG